MWVGRMSPNEVTPGVGWSLPLLGFHESDFPFQPFQQPI